MKLFGGIGPRDRHAETMRFDKFDAAGEQHLPDMEDPHIEERDMELNASMAGLERSIGNRRGAPAPEEMLRSLGRRDGIRSARVPESGMDRDFDSLEAGVVDWFRDEAQLDDPRFALARR